MQVLTNAILPVIEIDGIPLEPNERVSVATVLVSQRLSRPSVCEFVLRERELPAVAERLSVGQSATIRPRDGEPSPVFVGEVTALQRCYGPAGIVELRVRCYDLLHRLRKRQPVRVHDAVDCRALAAELLADDGIAVVATAADTPWRRRVQYRQTDFDLLAEACRDAGLGFFLDGEVLRIHPLSGNGRVANVALGRDLLQARVETNADSATASVRALGWDTATVGVVAERADDPRATSVDPSADSGPGFARGEWSLLGEVVADAVHAASLAQSELDERASTQVVFWGETEGSAVLFPGVVLEVDGLETGEPRSFALCEVVHRFDTERGYTCELNSRPPRSRRRPWGTVTATGVVIDIDDPERAGRVRVRLPAYDDLESHWFPVALPAVGPSKGILALPDVDDLVLLLFAREDLDHGVVIGGLYGPEPLPEPGGPHQHQKRSYTLRTAGKQLVHLDDVDRLVRVEIADGSFIELAPDLVRIHACADLQIEAPGHQITFAASKVDFRKV